MKAFLKLLFLFCLIFFTHSIFAQEYVNGFAKIEKDGKFNFLNEDGDLISKVWFDAVTDFTTDGLARVQQGKLYVNFIKKDGTLLSKTGYGPLKDPLAYGLEKNAVLEYLVVRVYNFDSNGLARYIVMVNDKNAIGDSGVRLVVNWIKKDGTLLRADWLKGCYLTDDKYNEFDIARMEYRQLDKYVSTSQRVIPKDSAPNLGYGLLAKISDGKKFNFLKADGKLLSKEWYDDVNINFESNTQGLLLSRVMDCNKFNFMKISDGTLVSKDWFTTIGKLNGDLVIVQKDSNYNVLRASTGTFISQKTLIRDELNPALIPIDAQAGNTSIFLVEWLDNREGTVRILGKDGSLSEPRKIYNNNNDKPEKNLTGPFIPLGENKILQIDGTIQEVSAVNGIALGTEGLFKVWKRNSQGVNVYNFIRADKSFLCNEWYTDARNFKNDFAAVARDGKWNFINRDGTLLSHEWFYKVEDFNDGFAQVARNIDGNTAFNFINTDGTIISQEWFHGVTEFTKGTAQVYRADFSYNFIRPDGTLVYTEWTELK